MQKKCREYAEEGNLGAERSTCRSGRNETICWRTEKPSSDSLGLSCKLIVSSEGQNAGFCNAVSNKLQVSSVSRLFARVMAIRLALQSPVCSADTILCSPVVVKLHPSKLISSTWPAAISPRVSSTLHSTSIHLESVQWLGTEFTTAGELVSTWGGHHWGGHHWPRPSPHLPCLRYSARSTKLCTCTPRFVLSVLRES